MAKKKAGLAQPERTRVTIKGDESRESYIDALQAAVEANKAKTLVRIHTERTHNRRVLHRTFIFES